MSRRRLVSAAAVAIAATLVGAVDEVHAAPARGPAGHAADLSGIWVAYIPDDPDNRELRETMARYRAVPNYRPGWAERVRETWAKSERGEKIYDAQSDCLPPGLANWYQFVYPAEILMTPGQVTINTEYFNQTRRVFTDGRKHLSEDDLDPTFLGHSIGRWEGDVLVVDTVGLRNTLVSDIRPHSEQLHVTERIRPLAKDRLEWVVTMEDPVAFQAPFVLRINLRRAPADFFIREMVCQENRTLEKFAPPSDGGVTAPR